MRGRSRISFADDTRNLLQKQQVNEEGDEMETRADWLRGLADDHTIQGNRLTNVACRMKATASLPPNVEKKIANRRFNNEALDTYLKKAHKQAKREQLTEIQKSRILADWASRKGKGRAKAGLVPAKMPDEEGSRHIDDIQTM